MENQQTSTKQIMLNYGLYSGIAAIIISVLNYAIGNVYEPHWWVMAVSIIVSIAIIILGIKSFKDSNDGYLSIGEAIKIGVGIALIGGIIGAIYMLIFTNFIETDFYTRMAEVSHQKLLDDYPDFSDEQLEAAEAMAAKFQNPIMTGAFQLMGSLIFGLVISLVGGLILKNNREEV
ncbi:MAG: DUF4199 domain-containing protein [Flavobacteriaceae bacterium]|nr:DUF4199 domain-containing protein [Flavobacteriaceae bacterium]